MPDQAAGPKCCKILASCGVLSIRAPAGTMAAPSLVGNDCGGARSVHPPSEYLMSARLYRPGWAPRAILMAALLPLLADCGPARDQFAPPCPGGVILGDAADLDIYRPGGRDLTDLVLHAKVIGIQGQ